MEKDKSVNSQTKERFRFDFKKFKKLKNIFFTNSKKVSILLKTPLSDPPSPSSTHHEPK